MSVISKIIGLNLSDDAARLAIIRANKKIKAVKENAQQALQRANAAYSLAENNSGSGGGSAVSNTWIQEQALIATRIHYADAIIEHRNLVNPAQSITPRSYYVNKSITTNGASDANTAGTEYIQFPTDGAVWVFGVNTIQVYDADYKALFTETVGIGVTSKKLPLTSNGVTCKYLRVSSNLGATALAEGLVGLGYGTVAPLDKLEFGVVKHVINPTWFSALIPEIQKQSSTLFSKTWVSMGDSISATGHYQNPIVKKYGCSCINHSQGGARVGRYSDNASAMCMAEEYLNIKGAMAYNSITQTWEKLDSYDAPDVITVAAGINDPINNASGLITANIGAFSDRTTATFFGALHVLLSGLRSRFPFSRIGYISPIPASHGGGQNLRYKHNDETNPQFIKAQAIREVCAYYSIPVWEGCLEFGWNPNDNTLTKSEFMPDGLHPSVDGGAYYAGRLAPWLQTLAA